MPYFSPALDVTTSAKVAAIVTDETGTGALTFATNPTFVTPALGTPSSGTLTNCTGLPVSGITALEKVASTSGSISGTGGTSYGSAYPILLYVKSVTLLTSGTPADIATIAVPSGITRFRFWGTAAALVPAAQAIAETGNATGATFVCYDGAGGTGSLMTNGTWSGSTTGTVTGVSSFNNSYFTGGTIYIRQTANSSVAATASFYILILPVL